MNSLDESLNKLQHDWCSLEFEKKPRISTGINGTKSALGCRKANRIAVVQKRNWHAGWTIAYMWELLWLAILFTIPLTLGINVS